MNIFLFLEPMNETHSKVTCIHYQPNLLSEKEKERGVLIESYSEPLQKEGYFATTVYNHVTSEVEYLYEEIPMEETLEQLKQQQAELEAQIRLLQQTK